MRVTLFRLFGILALVLGAGVAFEGGIAQAQTDEAPAQDTVCPFPTGDSHQFITSAELERDFLLYIPAAYDLPLPLVISFHGFAASGLEQQENTEFNRIADENGFIVAYPQGTGFPRRWYGGLSNFANQTDARDVTFTADVIAALADCIDPARVYANGFSAGGGMSHRLACQLSEQITAIGTVSGAYSQLDGGCQPERAVPVISLHGTDDPVVPFTGTNIENGLPDINDWARGWAERNNCTPDTVIDDDSTDTIEILRYTDCDDEAEVILYSIIGGGHTWPGNVPQGPSFLLGSTNDEIIAGEVMWQFFREYALPG